MRLQTPKVLQLKDTHSIPREPEPVPRRPTTLTSQPARWLKLANNVLLPAKPRCGFTDPYPHGCIHTVILAMISQLRPGMELSRITFPV